MHNNNDQVAIDTLWCALYEAQIVTDPGEDISALIDDEGMGPEQLLRHLEECDVIPRVDDVGAVLKKVHSHAASIYHPADSRPTAEPAA